MLLELATRPGLSETRMGRAALDEGDVAYPHQHDGTRLPRVRPIDHLRGLDGRLPRGLRVCFVARWPWIRPDVPASSLHDDVRCLLRDDWRRLRELPADPARWRSREAVHRRVPVPGGRIPPSVCVQRPSWRLVLGDFLRDVLRPP